MAPSPPTESGARRRPPGGRQGTDAEDALLADVATWHRDLARDVARRNPALPAPDVHVLVSRLLERLVFLRLAEARGIATPRPLRELIGVPEAWQRLVELLRRSGDRFGPGFLPGHRRDAGGPRPRLALSEVDVGDGVLADVLRASSGPESSHAFAGLPAGVLGRLYERSVGRAIRLDGRGDATVERRKGARKSGGIFYTPAHVVRLVVESTVGRLLEGRTLRELASLRILDPACGAGTFLLAAYERLLDRHLEHYIDPANGGPQAWSSGRAPRLRRNGPDGWRLTTAERRRILASGIHGVDLDADAVEVARLVLLLAALDGEDERQLPLLAGRALPELDRQIRCGDALVGSASGPGRCARALRGAGIPDAFDWADPERGFGAIVRDGGFDAVVGNPPYLNLKRGFLEETYKLRLRRTYACAGGQYDSFALFGEKAVELLRPGGRLGLVLPRPVLASESYRSFREICYAEGLTDVVECGRPFAGAEVEAVVLVVCKNGKPDVVRLRELAARGVRDLGTAPYDAFGRLPNRNFSSRLTPATLAMVETLAGMPCRLGDVVDVLSRGLECGKKDRAVVPYRDASGVHRLVRGEDVARYRIADAGLGFDERASGPKVIKDPSIYEVSPKILLRRVANGIIAALDEDRRWPLNTLYCLGPRCGLSAHALLGILNSSIPTMWLRVAFLTDDKLFPYLRRSQLEVLPFPDPEGIADERRDRLEALVRRMIALTSGAAAGGRDPGAPGGPERAAGRVAAAIDDLVAGLYGLDAGEVRGRLQVAWR
ncbi:MAG: N-6 DNA methylase [Deltaproteobacteria bacterium]|nr:N-6 DNA methylase [Deltaproteobacteria bacterium]